MADNISTTQYLQDIYNIITVSQPTRHPQRRALHGRWDFPVSADYKWLAASLAAKSTNNNQQHPVRRVSGV